MANKTWTVTPDEDYPLNNSTSDERTIIIYQYFFERQIVAALFIIAAIVGTTGNSLVIIAVALSKKLRTTTNVFVVNLATADLLSSTFLPWEAVAVLNEDGWPLDGAYWICVASGSVLILCASCSINNLALIALSRWVGITRSRQRSHWMRSPRKLAAMVGLAWLLPSGCILVPLASEFGELGYARLYNLCSWNPINEYTAYFNIILLVVGYPIQLATIVFCYSSIYHYVRKNRKEMVGASAQQVPSVTAKVSAGNATFRRKLWKRQLDVTKNLLYIILAFVVSQTPYFVILTLYTDLTYRVTPYFTALIFCNCCFNPIIYATSHPDFKETFRSMLRCGLKKIPQTQRPNCHPERQAASNQTESNHSL